MRHAIRWGGEQQTEGAYRGPDEAHLPVRKSLYDRPHEEPRKINHGVQGTSYH